MRAAFRFASVRNDGQFHTRLRARDAMRPSRAFISRPSKGRGERRMPAAPAASCALCIGKKHTSKRVHRNHPAFPHAMVLTVSFALSPVTGLFCHRRPRTDVVPKPGRADITSANLTPASGRQDHTTSPYAATSFVSAPFDRSRILSQTRPASRFTPDAAASTASHPASVTIAIRPCSGTGWREFVEMICPTGEAKYFCKGDWTGKLQRRPTGKSLEPAGSNTTFPSLLFGRAISRRRPPLQCHRRARTTHGLR